ncbi:MAG: 4-phosphoerythronate dehydrogenase PdxB [Nitrospiraceae bacterium]|nr:4-phosphoerythronate dehydrogenase PdxB [Nitrospiraceae bacterium]
MKIVADENIPYVREAFAVLGEVVTVPGRSMDPALVKDAELLLVRSITKVNSDLLDGSRVGFVATATIGEDHVDKSYLADRGIAFSSAPGCNANSVGQYLTGALLALAEGFSLDLQGLTLGIVGVGNVGKRVLAKATALGLTCILNDPPLARETGDPKYRPLEEAMDCDFVTLHVPLTREGEDATYHLADAAFLQRLKSGAVLINSSRGPVADGEALKTALDEGHLRACVLDVWEGEPDIDVALLERVFIGTPHIAGYSFDGKVNGTRQIYEAACRYLGVEAAWDPQSLLPAPECPEVTVDGRAADTLHTAVRTVYDIRRDDDAMRGLLSMAAAERPAAFDRLRKEYPRRREFFNTVARVDPPDAALMAQLEGVGFSKGQSG